MPCYGERELEQLLSRDRDATVSCSVPGLLLFMVGNLLLLWIVVEVVARYGR